MTQKIEFFFDLSSPWTCIAFHNIRPLLADTDVEIQWRPFLVGGIHNAVNQGYVESRAKALLGVKCSYLREDTCPNTGFSHLEIYEFRGADAEACAISESDDGDAAEAALALEEEEKEKGQYQ